MSSSLFKSPFFFSSFLLTFIIFLMFSSSSSSAQLLQQTCSTYSFGDKTPHVYNFCNDLPVLNSFIHWNFNQSTRIVDIAYRHANITASTWVAWAINPTSSTGMVGAQAFVAFQGPNGSMHAYSSPLNSYTTQLQQGPLSFPVHDISATYANNEITILATFELPDDNITTMNQLWQDGPLLDGITPGMHRTSGPNVGSFGSLNLLSGYISKPTKGGANPRIELKNVHGMLNAVSWGILMPLGVMIARNLKRVDSAGPAWFYLHIACQTTAYAVGVGGWATGLVLGKKSSGIQYNAHRNIGNALFALATLQVLAMCLRPKPDHKYRCYWNVYHQLMGYVVIVLSVLNVLKGFDILHPDKKWVNIYRGVINTLSVIFVALDFIYVVVIMYREDREDENTTRSTTATELSTPDVMV